MAATTRQARPSVSLDLGHRGPDTNTVLIGSSRSRRPRPCPSLTPMGRLSPADTPELDTTLSVPYTR